MENIRKKLGIYERSSKNVARRLKDSKQFTAQYTEARDSIFEEKSWKMIVVNVLMVRLYDTWELWNINMIVIIVSNKNS